MEGRRGKGKVREIDKGRETEGTGRGEERREGWGSMEGEGGMLHHLYSGIDAPDSLSLLWISHTHKYMATRLHSTIID